MDKTFDTPSREIDLRNIPVHLRTALRRALEFEARAPAPRSVLSWWAGSGCSAGPSVDARIAFSINSIERRVSARRRRHSRGTCAMEPRTI